MKQYGHPYSLLIALLLLLLNSCAALETISPAPTATSAATAELIPTAAPEALSDPLLSVANIESLEIMTLESFPVQINIRIAGVHPNDCTEIADIVTQQEGNSFSVAATTVQQRGQDCAVVDVPFEEIVALDVYGFDAGSYTVNVNSIQGSFALETDNRLPEETAASTAVATVNPTATPVAALAADTFAAGGRVWHDLCPVFDEEDSDLPEGCVTTAAGAIQADGLLQDEPGIEGVQVSIGQGSCPSTGLAETVSGVDGEFSFAALAVGTYCISIDTENEQNQQILLPGDWTAPEDALAAATILLSEEEPLQTVDFGWDYQLLPAEEADPALCSDSFEFVADVNIPDDTIFAPGEAFTKRWQLRNNGTCSWSEQYSVIFVGGDQMSADETIPLAVAAVVGQTVEVAIDMIAPDEPGTYRGNWQVANVAGEPFGIDGLIEDAFWLSIVVEEEAVPGATAEPGSGAIGGVVWDDFCINGAPGRGCQEFGEGSGIYTADGTFDGLETALSEITISLAEDACPSDGSLPTAGAVVDTAVTDEDGLYRFENLSQGTYCIYMDALSSDNVDFLIPGNWTWPGPGVGQYTFILDPGEQALDRDFGWDFVE